MLYNSYEFILVYLPITFFVYYWLNRQRWLHAGKIFLVLSSFFFYGYWNSAYVPLLFFCQLFNYALGRRITQEGTPHSAKKAMLIGGILFNLLLLGYYKYTDFLLGNVNLAVGSDFDLLHLTLPLALSFVTFQQIAYLVDSHKGETGNYSFLDYMVFILFFPQLIAGPIVHHKEILPQFANLRTKYIDYRNIATGLFIFSIGLFKKVVLADTFAQWADAGFANAQSLAFIDAWAASLSYTFQLYFDFSGYADMAIGLALLFNIKLPINFNSPYKATDIQDFWRRWHMTLSRFLRDYIYIPLGGNRKGAVRTYTNLLLTFLLGGIWHGAGWTFVVWGLMHGAALVVQRMWSQFGFALGNFLGWLITFNFVNIAWVFFRAEHWSDAIHILRGMVGLNGIVLPDALARFLPDMTKWGVTFGDYISGVQGSPFTLASLLLGLSIVVLCKNSMEKMETFQPSRYNIAVAANCFAISLLGLYQVTEFLYFNF